jgi:hypothetical protein
MVCALFRNQQGHTYSRSRLYASSYRRGSDECGPMVALRAARLVYFRQPPLNEANPRYIGPPRLTGRVLADGSLELRAHAFGVHWLDTAPPE